MKRAAPGLLALLVALAARGQTMLDQQQRLIEIHSLLLALQPGAPPGSYAAREASLSLEVITIPTIDGTTGGKRQITASDHTPVFPRVRAALGLPAPEGFRAFVGGTYVPPIVFRDVSSHQGALEAGLAWVPGPFALGLRAQGLLARSTGPVTDPATRDTLHDLEYGGDLSAAYTLTFGSTALTPFAGVGLLRVQGSFQVTSDGVVLRSNTVNPSVDGGVRFYSTHGFEAVAQITAYPGRLVHPGFSVGWVPRW